MIEKIGKFKKFIGKKTWRAFWVGIGVGLLWFLVEASFVFVLQGFLRSIGLLNNSQVFLPAWYPSSLESSIIILVIFGVFRSLNLMLKNYSATSAQVSFTCHQRSKLLNYGIREAGQISPKELISVFSELVTQSGIVVFYISMLINTFIAALLLFLLGFKFAPFEMIFGVVLLFILLLPFRLLTKKINFLGENIVKEWEKVNESLLRGLKNNFLLKIYNQFELEIEKGDQNLRNYEAHHMKYSLIAGVSNSFSLFIGVMVLSFIAYLSVHYFHTSPIKLVSFFYIFIRLAQSASEGNATVSSIRLNWAGFKILYAWSLLADEKLSRVSRKEKISADLSNVHIKLENVGFSYVGAKPILDNLSFEISKGDVFVIRGESGVGKSTLLSLILGVNEPTFGAVLINGYNTNQIELDTYRYLAYVGPEPFLIEGSIKENLLYGQDQSILVTEQEMYAALELMELGEIVRQLPGKLEEFIFNIPQLSTGQKQRLAFARAMLRKPSLLILDEATANLDSDTEAKILNNISSYLHNCTTIVVTHKSSFDLIATKNIALKR